MRVLAVAARWFLVLFTNSASVALRTRALVRCLLAGVVLVCVAYGEVLDKAVLNSTVWISYETPARPAPRTKTGKPARAVAPALYGGSGFLLFRDMGYTKGQVYLITNKHVLPPEGRQQDIRVRVVAHDKNGAARVEAVSVPIVGNNGKYLDSVRIHPDPDTDVAAVNIAPAAFGSKFQLLIDAVTTRKYLEPSMLLTTDKLKDSDIGVGSQVYVVGFPAAIFDPRNVSPILRIGIISTDPREGFSFNDQLRQSMPFPQHVNGFLIDANVYPGSSGSLVVLVPDKQTESASASDWQPRILGIVGGSIPIFDASLHSYERIGLGIVYSADTIKEVLQSFDSSATKTRIPTQAPNPSKAFVHP